MAKSHGEQSHDGKASAYPPGNPANEQALALPRGRGGARARPLRSEHGPDGYARVAAFVQEHLKSHVALACAYVADADVAEDVVHTVLGRVLERAERFGEGARALAYLRKAVRNEALHVLEQRARTRVLASRWAAEQDGAAAPTQERELHGRRVAAALSAAIERLSPQRRAAYLLVRVQGLSYRQAAEVMGCAWSTVKVHLRDAEAALRKDPTLAELAQM